MTFLFCINHDPQWLVFFQLGNKNNIWPASMRQYYLTAGAEPGGWELEGYSRWSTPVSDTEQTSHRFLNFHFWRIIVNRILSLSLSFALFLALALNINNNKPISFVCLSSEVWLIRTIARVGQPKCGVTPKPIHPARGWPGRRPHHHHHLTRPVSKGP